MIHSKIVKIPWRHLGVFSFYDAPYIDNDKLYLSSREVLLAIAAEFKNQQNSAIFYIDASNNSDVELQRFIQLFCHVFPQFAIFYFGPKDSERTWLHEYESVKIPLRWLMKRPDLFAKAISDSSPIGEILGPADVSFEDITEMKDVLIDKLGPPSLSGEVLGRFGDADVSEYAGEAVGIATALINPAVAVSRGVRYLGKFVSLVRKRRQKEIRELHAEWRQKVVNAYSEESIKKLFDISFSAESKLIQSQSGCRPILVLMETRETLYDVFMPLIFHHLIEELGNKQKTKEMDIDDETISDIDDILDEEIELTDDKDIKRETETTRDLFKKVSNILLFIDFGTHFSNFKTSFQHLLKAPDRFTNVSLSASFYTEHRRAKEALGDAIQKFINTRAIVFDLHPALFDLVTMQTPVTTKAWVQSCLREIKAAQSHNALAFLEYSSLEPDRWIMRSSAKRGVLTRIRRWYKSK
jgi:hypothetical protein